MTPNHHRAPDHGAPISNTPHSARAFTAEDGSSLVEFALTLPMFMLVVTGVLYLGIVLFNFITLTEATQFSARQMMISRGQTTDPCALFISTFYNSAPTLTHSNLTFSFSLNGTQYLSTTSCPAGVNNMVLGSEAIVLVTYPAKLALVGDVISPGFNLSDQELEQIQ
ncbi:TadE/TadG family type IV pilus assembly protein [Granulicella tundricola]|uniref:TadE family protein n=1 Tax=Granulicella tundricola (strain ATCC BAA-1859 / DSM 23138 / MP5ACTX9) TaxID=1198114 RepID=E8WY54_GRATM|nr:TadE family protein [Granulicella tundricola]ADW68681.1 TadE family protein [Granulicella tundricola MP5ACTX9]